MLHTPLLLRSSVVCTSWKRATGTVTAVATAGSVRCILDPAAAVSTIIGVLGTGKMDVVEEGEEDDDDRVAKVASVSGDKIPFLSIIDPRDFSTRERARSTSRRASAAA